MKKLTAILTFGALLAFLSLAWAQGPRRSLSIRSANVGSPPSGELTLTGGGSFDSRSGLLQVRGGLRCTRDVAQGPLAGCRAGDDVRWEGANIIPTLTPTGTEAGPEQTAVTDASTLVMQAEFFRRGAGAAAAHRAKVIVSSADLDPGQPEVQNVWIEGVGYGSAVVSFR